MASLPQTFTWDEMPANDNPDMIQQLHQARCVSTFALCCAPYKARHGQWLQVLPEHVPSPLQTFAWDETPTIEVPDMIEQLHQASRLLSDAYPRLSRQWQRLKRRSRVGCVGKCCYSP